MKNKTKKIMARLGAGLMLGLSLFNIGATWGKRSTGILPRRPKIGRKKAQEQITQENQTIEQMAEQEVATNLTEVLKENVQQEVQQVQQGSFFQKAFFYGAIGTWALTAGIVFTSAIFNQPFSLGKGMLSLLPGNPHLASVALKSTTAKSGYQANDEFTAQVLLNTKDDAVENVQLVLNYNPSQLEFIDFQENSESTFVIKDKEKSNLSGQVFLNLGNSNLNEENYRNEFIAKVNFKVLDKKGLGEIKLNRDRSLVLKPGGIGRKDNILGRASSLTFLVK